MVPEVYGMARVHDGVLDCITRSGKHCLGKSVNVEVGPSPLRYLTAVFIRAMRREKVKWRSPKPPWWRGA